MKNYEIKTIEDISNLITHENFENFFIDMLKVYKTYLYAKEKIPELKMPHFTWIDDGKHEIKVELLKNN